MAQEAKEEVVDPEQCWKKMIKHKDPEINYFILDLNGNESRTKCQGQAAGVSDVMDQAAGGNLVYLRVDQHEEGSYDKAVVKQKFARIQVNPDGVNAMKLIAYNNKANQYNNKKAVHYTEMIKAASAEEVDLERLVVHGKFAKSAHSKDSKFKFGDDEYTLDD